MKNNNTEIWENIHSYNGRYKISNLGNIKSITKRTEKMLKNWFNHDKYFWVNLCKNNNRIARSVHELVAEHFISKTDGKNIVRHINFNRQDNRVENLEWTTHAENCKYSYDAGRFPTLGRKGELCPSSKLKQNEVDEIRRLYKAGGIFQYEIAQKYEISQTSVSEIINNITW